MLVDQLVSIVAPFECLVCGREGPIVCDNCLSRVAVAKRSSCFLCNRLTRDWRVYSSCRYKASVRGVIVASHYESQVKKLIRQLKYHRAVNAAQVAAKLLAKTIPNSADFTLVTWVPSGSSRFRHRGYNPAKLIAQALARQLKLGYAETLSKLGQTRQVGTARRRRIHQVAGTIYPRHSRLIKGAKILLIDDVVTTGATINECAKVLKATGAKFVWGAAVAKH